MISENDDSIDAVNELLRKISIKETQLKIAQESNLIHTAEPGFLTTHRMEE
ncbi:hypothetical protein H6G97_41670 [Nostoc flagelliforme FACHB-838]|uniref:Transposase n=1 Tax=Nostoc flagelliforme FACHB-838 TaxID=2692904 RepID=A0ABR8E255_9NOSO|nr:hypothetical protein [Nostoc flagelliforme FACHB-838]